MPVGVPAYGGAYNQAEQNANAATICGYIDDANATIAADATKVAAIKACFAAIKRYILITNTYKPNAEIIDSDLAKAFADVDAAL